VPSPVVTSAPGTSGSRVGGGWGGRCGGGAGCPSERTYIEHAISELNEIPWMINFYAPVYPALVQK